MENQLTRVVQFARSDGNFVGVIDALVPDDTAILVADKAGAVFATRIGVITVAMKDRGIRQHDLALEGFLVYLRWITGRSGF